MHCPNCANESDLDQKFCRKCGFNLEPIGKLILASSADDDGAKMEKVGRDKLLLRRMVSWMMWGCLILLIGLVLLVTGKAFDLPKFLSPLASFLLVGGAATAGYGVLAALRDGLTSMKTLPRANEAREQLPGTSTNESANQNVPMSLPSVTERTTQLIGKDANQNRD